MVVFHNHFCPAAHLVCFITPWWMLKLVWTWVKVIIGGNPDPSRGILACRGTLVENHWSMVSDIISICFDYNITEVQNYWITLNNSRETKTFRNVTLFYENVISCKLLFHIPKEFQLEQKGQYKEVYCTWRWNWISFLQLKNGLLQYFATLASCSLDCFIFKLAFISALQTAS